MQRMLREWKLKQKELSRAKTRKSAGSKKIAKPKVVSASDSKLVAMLKEMKGAVQKLMAKDASCLSNLETASEDKETGSSGAQEQPVMVK